MKILIHWLGKDQCGSGLNPGSGVISGLSLLLVLVLAPRVFLRVLRFPPSTKNNTSKFQFDLESMIYATANSEARE